MRRPRDLSKYGDKETALALLDELREMVNQEPDRIRLRLLVKYKRWDPEWDKSTSPGETP